MAAIRSSSLSIRLPSMPTIICPARRPACSAGEPDLTAAINAPRCVRLVEGPGGGSVTPSEAPPLIAAPAADGVVSAAGGIGVCGWAMMPEPRGGCSVVDGNVDGEVAPVAGSSEGAAPAGAGPGGVGVVEPGAVVVGAGVGSAGFTSLKPPVAGRVPNLTARACVFPSRTMIIVIDDPAGRFATAS